MNENEIRFYLSLSKIDYVGKLYQLLVILFFILNSHFRYFEEIGSGGSLVIALFFISNIVDSFYNDSVVSKSKKIIEKLISRDSFLIKQVAAIKQS